MALKSGRMGRRRRAKDEKQAKSLRRVELQKGESVVLVASPHRGATGYLYLITLGLYGIWRKRHTWVVTDRRVLVNQGILRRTERSIPISDIEDVTFIRRFVSASADLMVNVHGRRRVEHIGPVSARTARRIASETSARS